MKTLNWIQFLETQRRQHGKVIFRVVELANVAGRSPHALNVELARLVQKGVITRYATGVYGLPGGVTPEQLIPALDPDAYLTGMYALYRHNLITQAPNELTCFTKRRYNRSRRRPTPFGSLVFVCVSRRIYAKPVNGILASAEQALCDFTHLMRRQGVNPASLVTFQGLRKLNTRRLARLAQHYPASVGKTVRQLVSA